MTCRICDGTSFIDVIDLGATPFADDFLSADQLDQPETYLPLRVVQCSWCKLVQLTCVASREALYQNGYPYVSSTTEMGVQHYHEMARTLMNRFQVLSSNLAVDIGSNIGVLAEGFKTRMAALGVEPAPNIARMANLRGVDTINDFFSAELAADIVECRGQAAIVTGTNVVAHINDVHDLFQGLQTLLAPNGVFVFEAPYLGDLLQQRAYDTIYHEHLSYLSIRPIQKLCTMHGFELFDVERMVIHGGTLRYYIAKRGDYPVSATVVRMEENEDQHVELLRTFSEDCAAHRKDLNYLLHTLRHTGARIAAVSAPAKGMTLLGYCGIGKNLLDFVTEKAPLKIGKYMPGTRIPVVPDAELLHRQPDYALLLAWNFAQEIMDNLHDYRGKFILPIPHPVVVER